MSNQISIGVTQPILDALYDLKELETQAINLSQRMSELARLIRDEHFTTQEAVREELIKTQSVVSTFLQRSINDVWDASIAQMPENLSRQRAAEMVTARSVEIRNLQLQQEV